jgi:glycopeptide antibiotics resistance protein
MDYIVTSADPRIAPVYFVIAAILAIITAVVSVYYCRREKLTTVQSIALTLLTTSIFLVFASTVFSRTPTEVYNYELMPFWSYREIMKGSESLFWEDIFNVFMLLPIGVLLPIISGGNGQKLAESSVVKNHVENTGKKVFCRVTLIGFLISLTIEILQLVTKRGLFEFDDIFHNTLGVAIGVALGKLGYWIWWKVRKDIYAV